MDRIDQSSTDMSSFHLAHDISRPWLGDREPSPQACVFFCLRHLCGHLLVICLTSLIKHILDHIAVSFLHNYSISHLCLKIDRKSQVQKFLAGMVLLFIDSKWLTANHPDISASRLSFRLWSSSTTSSGQKRINCSIDGSIVSNLVPGVFTAPAIFETNLPSNSLNLWCIGWAICSDGASSLCSNAWAFRFWFVMICSLEVWEEFEGIMDIQCTYGEKTDLMLRVHCPLDCLVEGNLVPAESSNMTIITAEIKDGIGLNWVPVADMVSYQSSQVGLRPWAWNFSRTIIGLIALAGESNRPAVKPLGLGVKKRKNCQLVSYKVYWFFGIN